MNFPKPKFAPAAKRGCCCEMAKKMVAQGKTHSKLRVAQLEGKVLFPWAPVTPPFSLLARAFHSASRATNSPWWEVIFTLHLPTHYPRIRIEKSTSRQWEGLLGGTFCFHTFYFNFSSAEPS